MPETLLDEVTQADREAAAKAVRSGYPGGGNGSKVVASGIKGGLHDNYYIVQLFALHRLAALASLQPSVSGMSDGVVERVARAICGMTGCQAGTPSVQCSSRRSCQGDLRDVLSEYGDAARAAIAALSPEGEP